MTHSFNCPSQAGYTCNCGAKPEDHLTAPLPVAAPATWKEREDRVAWVRHNLTMGERAKLYRLERDEFRFKDYQKIERAEERSLKPKEGLKLWP